MTRRGADQDPFGQALYDHYRGRGGEVVIERDDGYVDPMGVAQYFTPHGRWSRHVRRAVHLVRGRVLDIGCGAGRVAIHLQEKGFDVLGVDVSPLAVKVCRLRGLKKVRVLSVTQLSRRLGRFDTLLLFGNNFGLCGTVRRTRWQLRRFHGMTAPHARIIAESLDPYQTKERAHRAYQRRNRQRGRMSGELRFRIRYQRAATPFIDWLIVSQAELTRLVDGTGWHVARFIDSPGPFYVAVLEKSP